MAPAPGGGRPQGSHPSAGFALAPDRLTGEVVPGLEEQARRCHEPVPGLDHSLARLPWAAFGHNDVSPDVRKAYLSCVAAVERSLQELARDLTGLAEAVRAEVDHQVRADAANAKPIAATAQGIAGRPGNAVAPRDPWQTLDPTAVVRDPWQTLGPGSLFTGPGAVPIPPAASGPPAGGPGRGSR